MPIRDTDRTAAPRVYPGFLIDRSGRVAGVASSSISVSASRRVTGRRAVFRPKLDARVQSDVAGGHGRPGPDREGSLPSHRGRRKAGGGTHRHTVQRCNGPRSLLFLFADPALVFALGDQCLDSDDRILEIGDTSDYVFGWQLIALRSVLDENSLGGLQTIRQVS